MHSQTARISLKALKPFFENWFMKIVENTINYAVAKVRKWNLPKNSRIKFQRRMLRELTKDAHFILSKTSKEIF